MRKFALMWLIFSGNISCSDLVVVPDQKRIVQRFIQHKQEEAQSNRDRILHKLIRETPLTFEQEKELKFLANKFANFTDEVYFGPSGLLPKAIRRLREQKNFDAFNSVDDLDKAVEELKHNDSSYRALVNVRVKRLEKERALFEEEISQIISEKSMLLRYEPVLKGLGATLCIAGFSAALYELFKKWKKPDSRFEDVPRDLEQAQREESGNPQGSSPEPTQTPPPAPFLITKIPDSNIGGLHFVSPLASPSHIVELPSSAVAISELGTIPVDPVDSKQNGICESSSQSSTFVSQEQADQLGLQLIAAVKNGNVVEVERLIKQGANVNLVDSGSCGKTILHFAVWRGDKELILLLLKAGADSNRVDMSGNSALLEAFVFPSERENKKKVTKEQELVILLLQNGAQLKFITNKMHQRFDLARVLHRLFMNHPLSEAVVTDSTYKIKKMLNYMSIQELNVEDEYGLTALHWAAVQGNSSVLELLLKHGADFAICDNSGLTALDLAQRNAELISRALITGENNRDQVERLNQELLNYQNSIDILIGVQTKCYICCDGEELIKTACHHVFHEECLTEWLKNPYFERDDKISSCPACKNIVGYNPS
jgi:ankyrin repeat protein